jgi:hypothetical protein
MRTRLPLEACDTSVGGWSVSLDSASPWICPVAKTHGRQHTRNDKNRHKRVFGEKRQKSCAPIRNHYKLPSRPAHVASNASECSIRTICTYRRCKFGRLSGLPALLTNRRKRCVQGGNVIRGEAAMQLAAHIVRGAHLGADRVAERERFFARGAEPPVACRIGHFELEIHCMAPVSANIHRSSMWGVRAVRQCEAGAMAAAPCWRDGLWTSFAQRLPT